MSNTSSIHALKNFTESVNARLRRREELLAEVEKIDQWLTNAASQINAEIAPVVITGVGFQPPRSLGALAVDILREGARGYSKRELRQELEKYPDIKARLEPSPNQFYTTINRYIASGKIQDVRGLLYYPEFAPLA